MYGAKVQDALDKGEEVDVIMPLQIKWFHAKAHSEMEKKKELFVSGLEQSGLTICMTVDY